MRKLLKERYGTKCYICGEEGAEYHHLLPLWMGGEDIITNFIPLCRWHHMLMHGRNQKWKTGGGRPKAITGNEEWRKVLDDYFSCRIGAKECKKLLGLNDHTGISDRKYVREYMKEKKIRKHRNNVDIQSRMKTVRKEITGWIEYEDGSRITFRVDQ